MKQDEKKTPSKLLKVDEGEFRGHLKELVRGSVEETLNTLLDAEADRICDAKRYERTDARKDTRAGSYTRKLQTQAGEMSLKVPKLRNLPFESSIIQRYRRRESSVEEAMIEMYLAGVSVRRVEDITEALWGTKVSPSTVSEINKKLYIRIEKWLNRKIDGEYPYVYLDGMYLKRSWGGEVKNVAILVAVGVNKDGYREVLGAVEGSREDHASWLNFLRSLKERGLKGIQLIISDKCLGLVESIQEVFPESQWQRCIVHFYRNVFSKVPRKHLRKVAAMLKAIHAQESRKTAQEKTESVVEELRKMKLPNAAGILEEGIGETLTYYSYPDTHWRKIRTNNPLERLIREIRRRTRVVCAFPDGKSALMLASARLRHVSGTKWGTIRYMRMEALYEQKKIGKRVA